MPKYLSHEEITDREARALATGILEKRLSALGLPLPKDSALALHVEQLLTTNPQIRVIAETRVSASREAYSESLKAIGLDPSDLADQGGTAFDLGDEDNDE